MDVWCPLGGTSVLEPMVVTGTVGPSQRLWWRMVFSPGFENLVDVEGDKKTYLESPLIEGATLRCSLAGSMLSPIVCVVDWASTSPCGASSCVVERGVCDVCGCFG